MTQKIFLSYAREDADSVSGIRARLEAAGHEVWVDTEAVVGGEQWRAAIVEGIDTADVVIIVLSRHSVVSGPVRTEADIASDANKPLIPVTLDGSEPTGALRFNLSGLQLIDMSSDQPAATQLLLSALDPSLPRAKPAPSSIGDGSKGWYKWAAIAAAVIVAMVIIIVNLPEDSTEGGGTTTVAPSEESAPTTGGSTTAAPTTTSEVPLIAARLTMTNDFTPGGRSLADLDRGETFQINVSTTLPHLSEIDIALFQTVELLIQSGLSDSDGRTEPRFVVRTRNEPNRDECDAAINAASLQDILLYSSIFSEQTGVGEWVCLVTTEGRTGAFRVAEAYDGTQLAIDTIVWE